MMNRRTNWVDVAAAVAATGIVVGWPVLKREAITAWQNMRERRNQPPATDPVLHPMAPELRTSWQDVYDAGTLRQMLRHLSGATPIWIRFPSEGDASLDTVYGITSVRDFADDHLIFNVDGRSTWNVTTWTVATMLQLLVEWKVPDAAKIQVVLANQDAANRDAVDRKQVQWVTGMILDPKGLHWCMNPFPMESERVSSVETSADGTLQEEGARE